MCFRGDPSPYFLFSFQRLPSLSLHKGRPCWSENFRFLVSSSFGGLVISCWTSMTWSSIIFSGSAGPSDSWFELVDEESGCLLFSLPMTRAICSGVYFLYFSALSCRLLASSDSCWNMLIVFWFSSVIGLGSWMSYDPESLDDESLPDNSTVSSLSWCTWTCVTIFSGSCEVGPGVAGRLCSEMSSISSTMLVDGTSVLILTFDGCSGFS